MSTDLLESIIRTLAVIRQVSATDLRHEIEAEGMEAVMVTSHEVVTVLVMLQTETGVDPTDPDVLKGCDLQSLSQLVTFVGKAAGAAE